MFGQFLTYAIPSVIGMFISSLYTIIDGIFVGRGVGDSALAAVNLVIPLTILFFGMATMMAIGGGSLISKNLGAHQEKEAVSIFRQVLKALIIMSLIVSLVCVIFATPIVGILGARGQVKELASDYLRFYALFCIPNLVGIGLNSFVRNDGEPQLAMISTISGAITNVLLDYIFIFILELGIKGAAIATGLGQIVTISILSTHFLRKKGILTFGRVKITREVVINAISIGLPSFLSELAFSVIIFLQNQALVLSVGEMGLAVFSILNYITTNVYMIVLGAAQGSQPLVSYNYGAKDYKKMLVFFRYAVLTGLVLNTIYYMICLLFGREIIGIFTQTPEIIEIGYVGLNIYNVSFFIVGINLAITIYYQAVEKPIYSNILCVLRSIVFLPICLYFGYKIVGLHGIWGSLIVSEILSLGTINLMANVKRFTVRLSMAT